MRQSKQDTKVTVSTERIGSESRILVASYVLSSLTFNVEMYRNLASCCDIIVVINIALYIHRLAKRFTFSFSLASYAYDKGSS